MEQRSIKFTREKETKNKVRFEEVVTDKPPVCGFIYLEKWYVGDNIDVYVTINNQPK